MRMLRTRIEPGKPVSSSPKWIPNTDTCHWDDSSIRGKTKNQSTYSIVLNSEPLVDWSVPPSLFIGDSHRVWLCPFFVFGTSTFPSGENLKSSESGVVGRLSDFLQVIIIYVKS